LEVATGATVVRVPRQIINIFYNEDYNIEDLREKWRLSMPTWYVQLSTARPGQVVVLDEFVVSAGTFLALKKMLCHFRKSVSCFITLLDLNPHKRQDSEISFYSLYEWQQMEIPEVSIDGNT